MSAVQVNENWCWAASISMVFTYAGYSVSQRQIVERLFHDTGDHPARAHDITELLGMRWIDLQDRTFLPIAQIGADPGRRFRFGDDTVIRELIAERPVLVGVLAHAMVLVGVEYERFTRQDAVRITGGWVIDPAPGQGLRRLRLKELMPGYVAVVRIEKASLP
jgi:hypothetical protein